MIESIMDKNPSIRYFFKDSSASEKFIFRNSLVTLPWFLFIFK